jgi:type II secretory pathway component GspD/PulD (secretin)
MQQLQQLVQQNANRPNADKAGGGKPGDESKPKLIVNERENSILVHATPDKMEIIRQAIAALDTPSSRKEHLLASRLNFQVHRLSTLDPATLVGILDELGDLSPATKIEVDATSKSLIVYGSLADQVTVKTLVDRLDGSTRSFYVISLRRLRAEEVAGTIMYMLGEEEEDNSRNSSSYYYSYYEYRYGQGSQQQEEKRPFRVDADIENNRLMLWANEVEREEVWDLLVKLGEVPSDQRDNETMRVLDLSTDANAEEMLERIRSLWPSIAPNELEIQPQPQSRPQTREPERDAPAKEPAAALPPAAGRPSDSAVDVRSTSLDGVAEVNSRVLAAQTDFHTDWREFVAQVEATAGEDHTHDADATPRALDTSPADAGTSPTTAVPESTPPPVIIQRGPNGRLILGSPDTEALNRIEDLIADLTPKRREYVIYKLKHPNTWAYDVEWNLNAFFEQEEGGESFRDWYTGELVNTKDKSPSRLSKRKPLKIIGDEVSRTILVQGATEDQLRTIAELIEIYDQPELENPLMVRETRLFTVKYSDAFVVAEAIKNAYRDLLSPNDPAFEKKNAEGENARGNATTITYDYGSRYGNNDDEEQAPERPARIGFKGALSMGVDEISNTIVVSAARGLLNDIEHQIKELDELAKANNNIRVMPVSSAINLAALRERMSTVLTVSRPRQNGLNGQQPEGLPPNGADPRGNFNNGFNNGWNRGQ